MSRILAAAVAALVVVGAAAARPGPPPEWQTQVTHQPLRAGATAAFTYRVASADVFTLDVSLRPLPRPLLLVSTRRTWTLAFPGGTRVERKLVLRVRPRLGTRVATRLCLTLRQSTDDAGGVPTVVPVVTCSRVVK